MHERRLAVYGSTEIPVRVNPCKGCGKPLQRTSVTGRDPKWCPGCFLESRNRVRREARTERNAPKLAERLVCVDCGTDIYRKHVSVTPTRCDPCAKVRDYQTVRRWIADHPEQYRAMARRNAHERRVRKHSGEYEKFDDREVFERDRWKCQICKRKVRRDVEWPHPLYPTLDHVVPVSEGGAHTRANARLACWECNNARGNRGGNEQLMLIG
jgi:5-methylcytosine-specific restriction endonuclease McrA